MSETDVRIACDLATSMIDSILLSLLKRDFKRPDDCTTRLTTRYVAELYLGDTLRESESDVLRKWADQRINELWGDR